MRAAALLALAALVLLTACSKAEVVMAEARPTLHGPEATLTLITPLDGLVVERNSNPGAEVRADGAGAALFTISDPTTLWATLDLDERQLALLKPGQAINLVSAAWPGQSFKAVDAASRTVKVRARVANPDGKLKAEMFATAQAAASGGLPLVPADAVFLRGEQSAVFVPLGGGRFERRKVEVRAAGPQWLQVVSGLAAGDQVVVAEVAGPPVLVRDVAQVKVGQYPPQGLVGQDETDGIRQWHRRDAQGREPVQGAGWRAGQAAPPPGQAGGCSGHRGGCSGGASRPTAVTRRAPG